MKATEPPPAEGPMVPGADEHLLPGEEPDTVYVDDAAHWIGVYEELLRVKEQLLEDLDQGAEEVSPEAARELDEVDRQALAEEQRQYLRRLAFWRQRLVSLQPNPPEAQPPSCP